jgi:hypothetical protein
MAGLLKRRRSFAQTFSLLSFEYTQVTSDERERERERESVVPSGILNAEAKKIIHFTLL